jgi:hypothetical protein
MTHKNILGLSIACAALLASATWACGGSSIDPVGGSPDGGGSGGGSGSGGSGGSSGASSGSGGSSSGASGSGSSSGGSSSGGEDGGGAVVTGNDFACGEGANVKVCNPGQVCCDTAGGAGPGGGGAGATCEAPSACTTGLSEACTADSCPSGAFCCATITLGAKGETGSTACVTGSCGSELQLCSTATPCPTGERCEALGAGGAIDVCRAGVALPDGGGGKPIPDASAHD